VFFQAMLLAGYAYAHWTSRWLTAGRHVLVHCALLLTPLLILPITLHHAVPPVNGHSPVLWLLLVLGWSVGLPFFAVSTSATVLQKWFSATDDGAARDPYFLYVASNLGSLIALLAYPTIVEPTLRLRDQAHLWTAGYILLLALTGTCAVVVWRRGGSTDRRAEPAAPAASDLPIAWARRARWVALAFVPSSLLLAVTSYVSTDVASVPLLWVLPLALYLLTFVAAFSPSAGTLRALASKLMPILVLMLALVLIAGMTAPLRLILPLHLVVFLSIALMCHGGLAEDRPAAARLTEFYFCIAGGGMLGGLFNALLAPFLFTGTTEYPIVLVAACLLRVVAGSKEPAKWRLADAAAPIAIGIAVALSILVNNRFGPLSRMIILGAALPALAAFSQQRHRFRFAASVAAILLAGTLTENPFGQLEYSARTFFGIYRVRLDAVHGYRVMSHGTTLHGMQSLDPRRSREPLSYYHRTGPAGQAFAALPGVSAASEIAVVGLGVGTLATYRAAPQHWTFYEIDPLVERVARDARYFTYLQACGAACTVVTGDGRISLTRAERGRFDVIVLDAFSSDAVPMHLLTREAMDLYLSRLAPGGAILIHISNMHLSLSPVLARIASEAGVLSLWQHEPPDAGALEAGKLPSEWFIVARERRDFGPLAGDPRWKVPPVNPRTPLWSDDFSNILTVLKRSGD
ncbi:MAG: fused MFS/spermidine synthase, partial [Acidobacteriota bacterium]